MTSDLFNEEGIIEAEQAVLGSMLIDARVIKRVLPELAASDFTLEIHRELFEAVSDMFHGDKRIDPVTILEEQRQRGTYREESRAYFIQLMDITPTAANVLEYTEIVKRDSLRRSISRLAVEAQLALREKAAPEEVCAHLHGGLEKVLDGSRREHLMSSHDAMLGFISYRDKLAAGGTAYVSTGYRSLDKKLGGGMVKEGLYILAARPGIGKSTLALQIADKVAQKGNAVLFVSLEMSNDQLTAKRIAVKTGFSSNQVLLGDLFEEELDAVCMAANELSRASVFFNRKPGASVADIALMARQVNDCALLIVDYLGLIRHVKAGSLYEMVTQTSNALKRLARSLGIPILCLAQMSRANEQRKNKKPQLSDLRDSGAIEQDADGVLLLDRHPKGPEANAWEPDFLDCIIAKNRHGATGDVSLNMYTKTGKIVGRETGQ